MTKDWEYSISLQSVYIMEKWEDSFRQDMILFITATKYYYYYYYYWKAVYSVHVMEN
jgi:hypothetical protein